MRMLLLVLHRPVQRYMWTEQPAEAGGIPSAHERGSHEHVHDARRRGGSSKCGPAEALTSLVRRNCSVSVPVVVVVAVPNLRLWWETRAPPPQPMPALVPVTPSCVPVARQLRVRLDRLEAAIVLLSLRFSERHWAGVVVRVAL